MEEELLKMLSCCFCEWIWQINGNLWLWYHFADILGPMGWNWTPQLDKATHSISIYNNLFSFHFISHISMQICPTFKETSSGEPGTSPGDQTNINQAPENADAWLADEPMDDVQHPVFVDNFCLHWFQEIIVPDKSLAGGAPVSVNPLLTILVLPIRLLLLLNINIFSNKLWLHWIVLQCSGQIVTVAIGKYLKLKIWWKMEGMLEVTYSKNWMRDQRWKTVSNTWIRWEC